MVQKRFFSLFFCWVLGVGLGFPAARRWKGAALCLPPPPQSPRPFVSVHLRNNPKMLSFYPNKMDYGEIRLKIENKARAARHYPTTTAPSVKPNKGIIAPTAHHNEKIARK